MQQVLANNIMFQREFLTLGIVAKTFNPVFNEDKFKKLIRRLQFRHNCEVILLQKHNKPILN